MLIYLIGYMGSGKTTLGRQLASRTGLVFLDLDGYIEKKYGKNVPEIFREEGEAAFREKEHVCLREVSVKEDFVIATGGGAPCFFDNMKLMNRTGCCVFLDVSAGELVRRIGRSETVRPLLQGKTQKEMLLTVSGMLDERRPYYEQAAYVLSGDAITVDEIMYKIGIDCG